MGFILFVTQRERLFEQALKKERGFTIQKTEPDGACLFRAIGQFHVLNACMIDTVMYYLHDTLSLILTLTSPLSSPLPYPLPLLSLTLTHSLIPLPLRLLSFFSLSTFSHPLPLRFLSSSPSPSCMLYNSL